MIRPTPAFLMLGKRVSSQTNQNESWCLKMSVPDAPRIPCARLNLCSEHHHTSLRMRAVQTLDMQIERLLSAFARRQDNHGASVEPSR